MLRLIAIRLAVFVPTLFAASIVLFITINVVPGSAAKAALGIDATPQAIARFEALNGLDRPLHVQYIEWLGKALAGDFGKSFQNHVPVGPEVARRLPVTLELAVLAFLIANLIAVPLGAIAAFYHQRKGRYRHHAAGHDLRRHSEFLAGDPAHSRLRARRCTGCRPAAMPR